MKFFSQVLLAGLSCNLQMYLPAMQRVIKAYMQKMKLQLIINPTHTRGTYPTDFIKHGNMRIGSYSLPVTSGIYINLIE